MKKRILSILVTVLMAFAMMPLSVVPAYADDPVTTTLGGVVYTLNEDGMTATVTDYDHDNPPSAVKIPGTINNYTVTGISNKAFFNCMNLTAITIPASVSHIGEYAFYGSGLTTVEFAEGSKLESIGMFAFQHAANLSAITIPASVTSIEGYAFSECTNLTTITIPAGVTSIGGGAFYGSGLKTVEFAEGSKLENIGADAFRECNNLKSIMVPASVTSIGHGAFRMSGLQIVEFAEESKLESIEKDVFILCGSLKSITIPSGVTSIGEGSFYSCTSLESITIPSNVTSIENAAFYNCPLTSINFLGSQDMWNAITGEGKPNNVPVNYGAFTVTFLDGQGNTLKTETVKKGEDATAPADPTRDGYTFNGWDKDFSNVTQDLAITAQWKKNPAPPEPKPTPAKVSGTPLAKMTASGKNSLTIEWNKVNGAAGYDIFFARCDQKGNKSACKNEATITGNNTFKWTKSGLRKGTPYKAFVKAYVMQDGKKKYVKTSPIMHAYTGNGTKKFTNAKSVSVNKAKVTLKKGKSFKIKAKVKKVKASKKLMPKSHVQKLRYMSSNDSVATVSKSGKITAKGKGSCEVYAYAHNGVYKKIKVDVK